MISLAIVLCWISVTYAHLCLISPAQRGSMNGINKPGAADCILLQQPCGGRARGSDPIKVRGGEKLRVTFQKNLDHWNHTKGNFLVNIGREGHHLSTLATIPDNGEPSLYIHSKDVIIPSGVQGDMILQVVYETKNPHAPPMFYQCSDIIVE